VTIGSTLATDATTNGGFCNISCTATNLTLIPANTAPGGLVSPANGTVTSWRLRANTAPNVRLRILHPSGTLAFTGAGTSGPAGFAGPGISDPIPTSLPIKAGDSIGLDSPNGNLILGANPGATAGYWNMPVLADGSSATATTANALEVLVQATVEPSNTITFGAPVLNKKNGTATLTLTVPNPGTLAYSGTGASVTGPASAAAAGPVTLTIAATGKKRKKLKQKGKAGVSVSATFTPTNGAAATQSANLTLRKKLKKK
jgi:hypothetical protein